MSIVPRVSILWLMLAALARGGSDNCAAPPLAASGIRPVFVENRGQFGDDVRFRTAWPSPVATVTDEGLVLTQVRRADESEGGGTVGHNVVLRFGSSQPASLSASDSAPTRCSYFLGSDASRWVTDVACWSAVVLGGVTPGVSVEIHGRHGVLEYDVLVAPGVSTEDFVVHVDGAESLQPRGDGSLDIVTPLGTVHQFPPQSWEVDSGGMHWPLACRVHALGAKAFTFEVASRTPGRALVIDPGLGYGTFVDGSGNDAGWAMAVDAAGSAYVAGTSSSSDFPVTPGAFQLTLAAPGTSDAIVARLAPDGLSLAYATLLGGQGSESPNAIKLDESGNAYVCGATNAPDYPTTTGAFATTLKGQGDVFVTKLNPFGTELVYSTLFGGNSAEGFGGLAVDAIGRATIGGGTGLLDLPVTPDALQSTLPMTPGGFVARLTADGTSIDYCTYIGGSAVYDVALDGAMAIYAAGMTFSPAEGLPLTAGAFQTNFVGSNEAFALKIATDGSLAWCTLLAGNDDDRVSGLEVDSSGHAVMTGFTKSYNFPSTPGSLDPTPNGDLDGYVVKLAADGSSIVWGTYLGGWDVDDSTDLALDALGNCYVVSSTASPNIPVTPGAFDTTLNEPGSPNKFDAHVAKISADGTTLLYGSFIGSTGSLSFDFPYGVAADAQGNAYITGYTSGKNFPTTPGSLDTTLNGFSGIFVAKFELSPWKVVGQGLAGAAGVIPVLSGTGTLQASSSTSLSLSAAAALAQVWLVLGLQQINAPLKGGTLMPVPLAVFNLFLPAGGGIDLVFPWPVGLPAGIELDLQAWVQDAAAVQGFSASNGLTAITP